MPAPTTAGTSCGDPVAVDAVIGALFADPPAPCDANRDGVVTAADLPAAVSAGLATPTPPPTTTGTASPTLTSTPHGSPTATPVTPQSSATPSASHSPAASPTTTPTGPTATPSATATATATPPDCPALGADLEIEIDNQTDAPDVTAVVTGERRDEPCLAGDLLTSYSVTVTCTGTGAPPCGVVGGLAPGTWRHSIRVTTPKSHQEQHQSSLLVAESAPNRVRFTAFATVLSVTTTANTGDGSLRNVLQTVQDSHKPALIQFDPAAFPPGVPTTIALEFQLPTLAAADVTVDGTDATGAAGNRVIDAGGLPIPLLSISGARNHIIGLRLQNAGNNNRDVLSIAGAAAQGNLIEHTIVQGAASGDGIGIDLQAGSDFGETVNIIRDCDVSGAADKGIKVTTGAYARVERSWVHDNANGGIQATLGGHVQAWHNVVERNRGSTAQNGLSANAVDDGTGMGFSELRSWGNIARGNGANGIAIRAFCVAHVRDDYLATNGSSGLRIFNDIGSGATALVEGTSAVCNGVDGAVVADTSIADFGGGVFGSPGNNAFAQNNLPGGGDNFRNATGTQVSAIGNQWEHCGREATCATDAIAAFDISDHGAHTSFVPAQAHRSGLPPVLAAVAPPVGRRGELLRIFGSRFNVIDGHFAEDACADVVGRNRCVPLRGNCVQIGGVSAPVEAVTPTMLVVRWPFTCTEPVPLVVTTDQGPTGATSAPFMVCTHEAPDATGLSATPAPLALDEP